MTLITSQVPDELLRVRTESGATLDAHFRVAIEGPDVAIYLESRSGAKLSPRRRNPDYNEALWYILTRLAATEAVLMDATVESSETREFAAADKRLVTGLAYPIVLAAHDPADLRLRITKAQRIIGRSEGSGPGGNNTKRIRLLVQSQDGANPGAVRDLVVLGSPDPVRDALGAVNTIAGRRRGQGFASDTASKTAVEVHAMDAIRRALEDEGWNVEDVSRRRSYDFHCQRDGDELRVEVKGTRGGPETILVTANEVEHAREHGAVALAIVSAISLRVGSDGTPVAEGGTITWFRPWLVDQGILLPLAYSWRAPGSG